jgi:hypothetical protein
MGKDEYLKSPTAKQLMYRQRVLERVRLDVALEEARTARQTRLGEWNNAAASSSDNGGAQQKRQILQQLLKEQQAEQQQLKVGDLSNPHPEPLVYPLRVRVPTV